MISIKNVIKTYKDVKIAPIDLEIPQGGLTSIIGPNGAGKSTTLNMLGRLIEADSGDINVGGFDLKNADLKKIAKVLTILRQENHFVTKLTVRQLVSFGRYPYSKGRLNSNDEDIISKYIDFLGLKKLENRYLTQLSGGERQRSYVAMVLAQETPYVFLDEPLNNLDIAKSVQMMSYLRKVCDELDRTILAVMHDINFAIKYSDYICAMKEGKVAAFGSIDEVIKADVLSEIYETPIEIIDSHRGKIVTFA